MVVRGVEQGDPSSHQIPGVEEDGKELMGTGEPTLTWFAHSYFLGGYQSNETLWALPFFPEYQLLPLLRPFSSRLS